VSVFLFLSSIKFIANSVIPDHNANVFNPPLWSLNNASWFDTSIDKFFSGLRRWDAIYFLHIARFGYTYENSLAFFPGYPLLCVRPLTYLFRLFLIESNAYLLSSIVINFIVGSINVYLMFKLALKYRLTSSHAYWSAIIYMINPASVFFLAPYSETLFLFSQLCGHVFLQSDRLFFSTLSFAFGSSIRSNGIVSLGFIVYRCLQRIYRTRTFAIPVHYFLLCLLPFVLTQFYQYNAFCFEKSIDQHLRDYGRNHNLKMPLSNFSSTWCKQRLPLSYQYVQHVYWNIGMFSYWTWKQLPNFLLAMPVFILVSYCIYQWYRRVEVELWKEKFHFLFNENHRNNDKSHWLTRKVFLPHVVYTAFLSLFALIFMHIQVATRFLFSSGPFLYLICADRVQHYSVSKRSLIEMLSLLRNDRYLFYYCFIYILVGICLFSNFLPWT
jgi:GPI mannosyltransferase 2